MTKLLNLLFLALLVLAVWLPVHTWLHEHLQLLTGFLVGSWLMLAAYAYEMRRRR